ncbi:MAG TPA: transposase [Methanoculleus sp.]|nr:transposase [Methanoculleus sp.]
MRENTYRSVSNYLRLSQRQFYLIDRLAWYSKNLYNVALYNVRQHYHEWQENAAYLTGIRPDRVNGVSILVGSFLPYTRKKTFPHKDVSNYARTKPNENYPMLHSDVAQQTIRSVEEAYRSYFGLVSAYWCGKLPDCPRPPHYLEKDGRYKLAFPAAHLTMKNGYVTLGVSNQFKRRYEATRNELSFKIPSHIKPGQIREVTILPINNGLTYKIEFIYKASLTPQPVISDRYLAIDLGLDNFATCVDSITGTATIIDGKYLKSINRWYNKETARLQSIKDQQKLPQKLTHRQARLLNRRNNCITEAMNRYVKYIVDYAVERTIGTIILPTWEGIKHNARLGKRTNQNFVQIPYAKFRQKLASKCELFGIRVDDTHDERYTSQVDALARDPVQKPAYGKTRRIQRGLYQSATGVLVNADVNGALNHLRNVAGDSVIAWIISSGRVNRPVRIRFAFEGQDLDRFNKQSSCELNCGDDRRNIPTSPVL